MNTKYENSFIDKIKNKSINLNFSFISSIQKLQIILLAITLFMVTYMLAIPFLGQQELDLSKEGNFTEGNKAPQRVISSKEIIYIDEEKFKTLKQQASLSVPLVFEKNYSILEENIYPDIKKNLEHLKKFQKSKSYTFNKSLADYEALKSIPKAQSNLLRRSVHIDNFENIIMQYINLIFSNFCISSSKLNEKEIENLKIAGAKIINIGIQEPADLISYEKVVHHKSLDKSSQISEEIDNLINKKVNIKDINSEELDALVTLSNYYLENNPKCEFKKEETLTSQKAAIEKVQAPQAKITAGEVIVEQNQIITNLDYRKLTIVNKYATRSNFSSITSILMTQSFFALLIIVFLRKSNLLYLKYISGNLIVFSIIWILIISTYVISVVFYSPQDTSNYESIYYFGSFVPIGLLGLLLGFIYDEKFAITIGFYLSFFVFAASRYNPTSFTIAISVCIVSAYFGNKLNRRIDFLTAGFFIGFVQVFISITGYLLESRNYWIEHSTGSFITDFLQSHISKITLICFINGFFCAITAQVLLPIYENIFNIPTRFKLSELADTSHPLIQNLLTKAPSTYTHTFLVAALSENAARKLNLDWLLTKVGVYFHDIGKTKNPTFFIENKHLLPEEKKVKITPFKAAQTVIDHVRDGLEMAKKAKLPREVIDFIPEHHGTSVMNFFYHEALKNATEKERKEISKTDFMYPGPKPQRKETGIVMIADSVEAASRSLNEVNDQTLDDLIQNIINIKLTEGQLDECGLTVGELSIIKESFKKVLLSSLHARPKYPKVEETKELEKKN